MSFVFEWDKLDDEVALQIEGMIHAHFQRIPKPAFMGNIAVSKFRFGSTPPSITVLDVTDPLEEWYVHMDQEEARLAQEAAEGGGGESMDEDELASGEEYNDEYSFSGDSIVMVGEGDDIEYLRSGSYEEDEQLETEEWMRRHQHRSQRQEGSGSDHEYYTSTREHNQHFKSAMASPTRISPSSSTSSSASGQSRRPSAYDHPTQSGRYSGDNKENKATSATSNRNNRNTRLGINTALASPGRARSSSSTKRPVTTHSLSSHASDDEIESEAFYTQGESTIYQRMKNLVLEPSSFLSSRPASVEGESPDEQPPPKQSTTQQAPLGAPLFSTTPGGPNGNANNGLGFGFNAGIGSSPGSVLSSVMQNRSATRPLSAASFYSTPPATAAATTTTNPHSATAAQHPQLYFPDLSGMVVSGNSLLGLRSGTPSRTIPSTPRGFESPTLAFSRRQSFSDGSDDPSANPSVNRHSAPLPIPTQSGPDHHQPTEYLSPVEALSFDAFSRQPKVVERLKNEDDVHPRRSQSAQSYNREQHPRYQSGPRSRPDRSEQRQGDRRRRRKGNLDEGYRRAGPGSRASFSPPPPLVSKRHENDIQLLLAVHYQGQMGFTVETELLLNYPTYAFLTLPVKLVITGFSFRTKMLMGYLRDHVNVSFLEPEDPNERIESQVGDEQKQAVLKNVGKIERFVVEQLRKFITEDFVYPSYHSVELQRAPAPAAEPSQPGETAGSAKTLTTAGSTGHDQLSRGVSPAPSTATESIGHEPYRQGRAERGTTDGRGGGRGGPLGSRGSSGSTTTNASVGGDASSLRARPRAASTYSRH
ncbi:Mitochondrial distribution and morphology protein 12 [Mortierella sp. AD032]|nr:Mitochondrial distribution and morphology protein 12 [Mortierella sp. AD032]